MSRSVANRSLLDIPLRRLRVLSELDGRDELFIRQIPSELFAVSPLEVIEPATGQLLIVLSGWACTLKTLNDGRRQIFGLLLPGDTIGDVHNGRGGVGQTVSTITPLVLADASSLVRKNSKGQSEYPNILSALQQTRGQVDDYIYDHVIRLGTLNAYERVGHLLLEIFDRLCAVGLTNGDQFIMPLTQERLGEMLGLSETHVNRTLRQLRQDALLKVGLGWFALPDRQRLSDCVGPPVQLLRRA